MTISRDIFRYHDSEATPVHDHSIEAGKVESKVVAIGVAMDTQCNHDNMTFRWTVTCSLKDRVFGNVKIKRISVAMETNTS